MKNGLLLLVVALFASCSNPSMIELVNGVKVSPKTTTDEFPKASLRLETPDHQVKVGTNSFEYAIENYALKEQSPSAKTNQLANSHKGQHIHFIVDNKPYQAKYDPVFEADLTAGEHVVLAFLSRSFHESIKSKEGYVLKHYQLNAEKPTTNVTSDPLLFYSRPKGTYSREKGEKVLLDFYLVNTALRADDRAVRVTLDGEVFQVDEWQPYLLEGLQPGTHTIQIELVDQTGKAVPGVFNNSGSRTFTIE